MTDNFSVDGNTFHFRASNQVRPPVVRIGTGCGDQREALDETQPSGGCAAVGLEPRQPLRPACAAGGHFLQV